MYQELILELFDKEMIKCGRFTLKSGKESYIYVDLRIAISYPKIFKQICDHYYQLIQPLKYNFICGVPYSALTFASGMAYAYQIPMLLKRKEAKEYGTKKMLEGVFVTGQSCVIIEDVITTGASILETIPVLETAGLKVKHICTLVDRNQGGSEHLTKLGYTVHRMIDLKQIVDVLYANKRITLEQKQQAFELM